MGSDGFRWVQMGSDGFRTRTHTHTHTNLIFGVDKWKQRRNGLKRVETGSGGFRWVGMGLQWLTSGRRARGK